MAPYVPDWLDEVYGVERFAPGSYWVDPPRRTFLWIAANELPLRDDLVPFLMARSGQALDEFGRWVASRRPFEWVLTMLEYLPMSTPTREDLLLRFGESEDPEIEARRQHILEVLLQASPKAQQRLFDSSDATEGLAAYVNKTVPRFKGV